MNTLRRLRAHVLLDLDEETLAADKPGELIDEFDLDTQTDVVRSDIDMTTLDELVQQTTADHPRHSTSIDAAMAVDLHRCLPLTRREAADGRLWAWLGLARYPDFVAWRWKPSPETGRRTADRFHGSRVRQAFARLWWAAELTRGPGGDYSLTNQLFELRGFQDVYEAIFGRAFCAYRPALEAFIEIVGPRKEQVIRDTAKELGYLMTTFVLETVSEQPLRDLLKDLVDRVENSN